LNASNKDINVVLSQVFDNMGVEYKIVDRQIILSRKVESAPVVQQQGRKVQGVVLDSSQEPIIGANVLVKGTSIGTITDIDGRFLYRLFVYGADSGLEDGSDDIFERGFAKLGRGCSGRLWRFS